MPTPNYDLGILITLNICITLAVLLASSFFTWLIIRETHRSQEVTYRVASIAERIDARLRRQ